MTSEPEANPPPAGRRSGPIRTGVEYRVRVLDPANEAEIDTVTRMCMATVLDTIPEFGHDEERARKALPNFTFGQMREMIRADLPKPTHRFLVATDPSGRVVGHSMISRKVDPAGQRYGYFFSRYVAPPYRRRGISARLMQEALAWFDGYDWDYLLAHTHASNTPLQGLFARFGFRVVERCDTPWSSLTLRLDRQRG